MKTILAILLFIFTLGLGFALPTYLTFHNVYADVCTFVSDRIVYPEEELTKWKNFCLKRSQLYKPWSDRIDLVKDIRQVLALLKVSHLDLYLPKEFDEVWKGIVEKTGLHTQFVDGELFIQKIDPESPAEKTNLKIGDIILFQNGEHPDPESIYFQGGILTLQNQEEVRLEPAVYKLRQEPKVSRLNDRWVHLEVPQFEDSFYKNPIWFQELEKTITPQDKLLMDFRGNHGGTFYSALHFLSVFMCTETQVGRLIGKNREVAEIFPLTTDMSQQIQKMMETGNLMLQTPPSNFCLQNKVSILINSETASMAEIVAVTLKEKKDAAIYGVRTAGETTIGFWYDFNEIYPGAQLTIPEARFISLKGGDLEGKGLSPDKVLYHKSEHWKQGKDSWIQQVTEE